MGPKLILALFVLTICSCDTHKLDNESQIIPQIKDPGLKPIYFSKVCQGNSCSYVHFLMLTSFDETKFNDYNFVYLADKYLDSIKTNLPVASIEFCKPFNFSNIGGSENDEQLTKNAIIALWYEPSSKEDRVPEISHVSIWTNNQRKDLDYLRIKSRRQGMEYYHNKK